MGHAVAVRTDYTADKVRRLAKRVKDAAQARRLPAIRRSLMEPHVPRQPGSAGWIGRRCGHSTGSPTASILWRA
jgi:hypothetical protein